jgi:hypothetical protein
MREKAGLTQRELSLRLKKPQSWVARCETAARRIDVAEWLEWAYGCRVDPKSALAELIDGRR